MQFIGNNNTFIVNGNYIQSPPTSVNEKHLTPQQLNRLKRLVHQWVNAGHITTAAAWGKIAELDAPTYDELEQFVQDEINWARNINSRRDLNYSSELGCFI